MLATYYLPTAKSIVLHLVILALFSSSWTPEEDDQFEPPVVIVKARILSMNDPILARQQREQEKVKAQQQARARAEEAQRREVEKRKAEQRKVEERKKQEQQRKLAERKKAEEKRKAEERRKQEDAKRLAAENKKRRELEAQRAREAEMANLLAEESEEMQADSDFEAVQSYIGMIQARIVENWHRPLSARNGMKTLLMIHLVPTGEVQNVYVVETSGDAAFDRSAMQAVQRAEKFAELQALDPQAFDKHFRTFRMLFKPRDLDR